MRPLTLSQKLILIAVVPSASFGIIFSYTTYMQSTNQAIEQQESEAVSVLNLAVERLKDHMYYSDIDGINDIIENLRYNPDFKNVYVLYQDGRILSDGTKDNPLYGKSSELFVNHLVSPTSTVQSVVEVDTDEKEIHLLFPIRMIEGTASIGFVQADVSLEKLKNIEGSLAGTLILIIILGCSVTTAILVFASRSIVKPIASLRTTASAIAAGNYRNPIEGVNYQKKTADEVHLLARDLEMMRCEIAEAKDNLEKKVEARTIQLQKANEELESLDKMKDEFISIASHEIRTPIQPIMMFSELALRGTIDANSALKGISLEAKRLKKLTDDILDVSKIDCKKINLDLMETDVNEEVESVIGSFKVANMKNDNVKLEKELASFEDGIHCFIDSERLKQVLNNIIGNAMKFTTKGTVKIRTSYSTDDCRFVIEVIDSGPGIPAEILPRLFEKFATRNVGGINKNGTGLGLYLSQALVAAHGGEIRARNNSEGTGATFSIMLPASSKFPRITIAPQQVRAEADTGMRS